jgi:hypothetical protein
MNKKSSPSKKPIGPTADGLQGTIDDFIGLLAGKTKKIATLEEINEAASESWAANAILDAWVKTTTAGINADTLAVAKPPAAHRTKGNQSF